MMELQINGLFKNNWNEMGLGLNYYTVTGSAVLLWNLLAIEQVVSVFEDPEEVTYLKFLY